MIEKSRVQSVVFPANGHLIRERVSGGYLLKIARLPTSLPVQCCTTGKLTSSDPIVVMSRGIGPWPFVPQSCMTGATPSFTMSLSSSLREGYSAKRPMTLTGVWGVLFALNAHPGEGTNKTRSTWTRSFWRWCERADVSRNQAEVNEHYCSDGRLAHGIPFSSLERGYVYDCTTTQLARSWRTSQ
jgi:hypothetical protein